jgi:uncharacterized membrane protein YfcA
MAILGAALLDLAQQEPSAWWEVPWVALTLLAIAGVAAGIINAIAGGGSFLTLPLLQLLGLGPGMASGTIRVGVVAQNLAVLGTFRGEGVRVAPRDLGLAVPMCIGALGGSYLATRLDDAVLQPIFGVVFVAWAVLLVVRPGKFSADRSKSREPGALAWAASFGIGIYGGFMQAGVGFPLLAMLVGHLHHTPVRANAIKAALVLAYTLLALGVFAMAGKVAWVEALVLAAGTMCGGWIGTRLQLEHGAALVRWFVLIMVAISGVVMIVRAWPS